MSGAIIPPERNLKAPKNTDQTNTIIMPTAPPGNPWKCHKANTTAWHRITAVVDLKTLKKPSYNTAREINSSKMALKTGNKSPYKPSCHKGISGIKVRNSLKSFLMNIAHISSESAVKTPMLKMSIVVILSILPHFSQVISVRSFGILRTMKR